MSSASPGFPSLTCNSLYTFIAEARIQPQPWQVRDEEDEVELIFERGPPLSLSPPRVEHVQQPHLAEGDPPAQTQSATVIVSIPDPLPNDLNVTLHRSAPFIILSHLYHMLNIVTVIIPAGQTSAPHSFVWFKAPGTGTVRATADCFQETQIPVEGLP